MKPYKFLLFDLDRTLLDFDADMLMAFQRLYEHCGFAQIVPYSSAMLDTYERYNNKWWKKFEDGECTKPELFRGRFVDFLEETGFSGDADRMNKDYFSFLGQGGMMYPGAEDMLKVLSQKYPIYIITNGNAATARTRLENSGVSAYIRDYFVSEAVGCAKPDVRYFNYVFSHIPNFEKERALVIGDSLFSDIKGAQNSGVDSVWYCPEPQENPENTPYTFRAESYGDIVEFLEHE